MKHIIGTRKRRTLTLDEVLKSKEEIEQEAEQAEIEAWQEYEKRKRQPQEEEQETPKITTEVEITPVDYIQVGINGMHGKPVLISRFEIQDGNNMDYENTHRFVLKKGLYMPTPRIFTTHFQNVIKAYKERKKKSGFKLLDGNGNPITGKELDDIYKHLTTDHIAVYGGEKGVWTWLNARFVEGTGFKGLDLETILGIDSNHDLVTTTAPLESCEWTDSYVEIDFNSQGLATKSNTKQECKQGENIYFYHPTENCVAGFDAGSVGAFLGCGWDPNGSGSSLGVFGCAEGTQKLLGGGK